MKVKPTRATLVFIWKTSRLFWKRKDRGSAGICSKVLLKNLKKKPEEIISRFCWICICGRIRRDLWSVHRADLEQMGVKLIEEALTPDYYDEGEDALYQVYEIKPDGEQR